MLKCRSYSFSSHSPTVGRFVPLLWPVSLVSFPLLLNCLPVCADALSIACVSVRVEVPMS